MGPSTYKLLNWRYFSYFVLLSSNSSTSASNHLPRTPSILSPTSIQSGSASSSEQVIRTSNGSWRQLYKNRSSRKIDSQRLFSREEDFPKTFSLTENQFSGKTYFYTIRPWRNCGTPRGAASPRRRPPSSAHGCTRIRRSGRPIQQTSFF